MTTLTPRPIVFGPHCWHDGCSMDACDHSGYAEHVCRTDGCPVCGTPSPHTVESWGHDLGRWLRMTSDEQDRVRAYWAVYPLMRRVDDPPVIPAERLEAARAVGGGR